MEEVKKRRYVPPEWFIVSMEEDILCSSYDYANDKDFNEWEDWEDEFTQPKRP